MYDLSYNSQTSLTHGVITAAKVYRCLRNSKFVSVSVIAYREAVVRKIVPKLTMTLCTAATREGNKEKSALDMSGSGDAAQTREWPLDASFLIGDPRNLNCRYLTHFEAS